jgi:hypothetical protein
MNHLWFNFGHVYEKLNFQSTSYCKRTGLSGLEYIRSQFYTGVGLVEYPSTLVLVTMASTIHIDGMHWQIDVVE